MSDHNLLLNESKTETLTISAPNRKHLSHELVYADVTLCHHRPSETPGLCGLTMPSQVSRVSLHTIISKQSQR